MKILNTVISFSDFVNRRSEKTEKRSCLLLNVKKATQAFSPPLHLPPKARTKFEGKSQTVLAHDGRLQASIDGAFGILTAVCSDRPVHRETRDKNFA
ncbi:hypothetical protein PGB90_007661 [Kerria lacca]